MSNNKMKQFFKSILKKIFDRRDYKLENKQSETIIIETNSKTNLLEFFFGVLQQINFSVAHIVDVGANHGGWTRETLKYFPNAYYTLLEPQAQLQNSLNDITQFNPKVKFHAVGAGKKAGAFKFTIVDRDDSCSFIYSEEEAAKQGFAQIEIPVVTLNDFLPTTNLPIPDIIKIDAEGLDLEVLLGANNYLGQTEIFMVEAAVMCKTYDNSLLKVMVFMEKNGYSFFDVTDLNRTEKHNALWLVEAVFIKKDGLIDCAINAYS